LKKIKNIFYRSSATRSPLIKIALIIPNTGILLHQALEEIQEAQKIFHAVLL
jgi:hypothetical protein